MGARKRALKTLGIELICAHSPQAKGRVEQVHQTFQDRFTKVLRLDDISDLETANARLQVYLLEHNQRFAKPPLDTEDAHRPVALHEAALRRILSPHHRRTVDRNGAIRFARFALQVASSHQRRILGKRLTVITQRDGIELGTSTPLSPSRPSPSTHGGPKPQTGRALMRRSINAPHLETTAPQLL